MESCKTNKRYIISIEGIASTGKEQLVKILSKDSNIVIIPNSNNCRVESTNGYKNVNDLFAENPYKFAYPFKIYQLLSKLDAYMKASNYQCDGSKKTILLDGSIESEKYIYSPMFLEFKFFNVEESAMYNSVCDWHINNLNIRYNGAIYVKSHYNTISSSKKKGNHITINQYLELIKNYEIWMLESSFPILTIDSNDIVSGEYTEIINRINKFIDDLC
ncbi:MPPV-225 deoxycytidine kinase-like protein [Magpiepox virus 2]|nr:deoxycytidine kinase-like protein [Magpiepox virus]QZW33536.1 MPPV-225 deoxycytidine kinase-like protein [Magpiepox virus 2]